MGFYEGLVRKIGIILGVLNRRDLIEGFDDRDEEIRNFIGDGEVF